MSKLKLLEEKINGLKTKTNETLDTLIKEVDDYNKAIERIGLKEPYTADSAPDHVKKLPEKKKRQWIHIWNSVFKQTKSETKAFKAANAILTESVAEVNALLARTAKKEIMQGLLEEIDNLISKANDGIKNKPGAPSIRNFLREVKNKMKSILGSIKESEIRESAERIIKSIEKLEEGSPEGSYEALRDQVQEALRVSLLLVDPLDVDRTPWIRYLFSDKVIVSFKDKIYQIAYAISEKVVKFGTPAEVTEEFVVKEAETSLAEFKESGSQSLRKSHITNKGQAKESDIEVSFVSLKESTYDEATGDINVILIEAGTNEMKRRHYPVKTITEAAPLFVGLKMYINHPTKQEEKERPERNLSDWASTIKESRAIDGKAAAKVSVHDPWLRERLANKTFRENVGLSINAGGLISYGKVNGKEMQIVEKITLNRRNGPASVDWVTEAGARGRVATKLFESRGRKKTMELTDVTLTEMLKERPDLIKELKESITKELKESKENTEKETKLTEALEKIAVFEKENVARGNQSLVEGWLKEKKVADVLHERITESLKGKEFKNEAELKEAFENAVKKEVEFLNKVSGKGKINLGEGGEGEGSGTLLESLGKDLDGRANIKEEKKEGDE